MCNITQQAHGTNTPDCTRELTRRDTIQKLEDDSMAADALLALFNVNKADYKGKPLPSLKGLSHMKNILRKPPFDLCYFQESVENFMHRSNCIISGDRDCALIEAQYAIPSDSVLAETLAKRIDHRVISFSARQRRAVASAAAEDLDDLRRGRVALNNEHGDDPLDAAVQAARTARASAGNDDNDDGIEPDTPGEKRKDGPRLTILDEIEEDEEAERAKLSRIPKRRRRSNRKATSPYAHMALPDDGIFDEEGKVLKRVRWTEEEKICVKEGVRKHGIGKWKQIKLDHDKILRNRTVVQIKDCWRTMSKKNEV